MSLAVDISIVAVTLCFESFVSAMNVVSIAMAVFGMFVLVVFLFAVNFSSIAVTFRFQSFIFAMDCITITVARFFTLMVFLILTNQGTVHIAAAVNFFFDISGTSLGHVNIGLIVAFFAMGLFADKLGSIALAVTSLQRNENVATRSKQT